MPPPRAPKLPAEHHGSGGRGSWGADACSADIEYIESEPEAQAEAEVRGSRGLYYPLAEAPCWADFEPHNSRCEFEGFATGSSSCMGLPGSLDGLRTRARSGSPTRAVELPACPPDPASPRRAAHAALD